MDRNPCVFPVIDRNQVSLSVRRAWIEMLISILSGASKLSLSVRRAWIEIIDWYSVRQVCESLSVRRAWIEIQSFQTQQPEGFGRSP